MLKNEKGRNRWKINLLVGGHRCEIVHTKVLAVLSHITHYIKPLHDVCLDYIFLFWFAFWAMLQKVIMIPLIENGKPATMARSILKEHCLKLNISQNKKITKVAEDNALKQMIAIFGLLLTRKIWISLYQELAFCTAL